MDFKNSEPSIPGIWKLAESKRAPNLDGWKNFKGPPSSRQFEVNICFFFSKHVWEPHRYIITRYLIILITLNINLDTRLDPQSALLQFLKKSPQFGWVKKLRKTDWPEIQNPPTYRPTDRQTDKTSIWVSGPRQTNRQSNLYIRLYFCMVKYLNFHNSSFALRYFLM